MSHFVTGMGDKFFPGLIWDENLEKSHPPKKSFSKMVPCMKVAVLERTLGNIKLIPMSDCDAIHSISQNVSVGDFSFYRSN